MNDWPVHEEWLIAEGLESMESLALSRWYVLHCRPPRFLAEIADDEERPEAVIEGGLTWSIGEGQTICNVVWFDEPPPQAEMDSLMFYLREVLDDYDERVSRRVARQQRELGED